MFHAGPQIALRISVLAMLLLATTASAAGINLAWDHCRGEGAAARSARFACDTNQGTQEVVGSFVLDSAFPLVIGIEVRMHLIAESPTVPPWWQFHNDGACRQFSLRVRMASDPADALCPDWAGGMAMGGLAGYWSRDTPRGGDPGEARNTVRIPMGIAVAQERARELIPDQEYFAFALVIDHEGTVGSRACGGCTTPVSLVLNSINVVARDNVEARLLADPMSPGSNVVTWQPGGPSGYTTASRQRTWAAVKALYH